MINPDYIMHRYGKALLWYILVFVCIGLEWWLMKTELGIEYTNIIGTLLKATGDVALVLLPYWLLNPRWRWAALLPVWLFGMWAICNLAYFRFWGDLIPPAAVTMGGNVDVDLAGYGLSLLTLRDCFFVVLPLVATTLYFVIKP